jgi:hypothetical protein
MLDAESIVYLSSASRNTTELELRADRRIESRHARNSLTGPRLLQPALYTMQHCNCTETSGQGERHN